MTQDPYQTLGISPTATLAEARVAYTKRVRVLHPDRFDPVSQKTEWELANQMLQEVHEAWDTVRNISAFSPNRGVVPPPIPRPAPTPPQPQRPYAVSPKPRGRTASPSAMRNMAIICVLVVITAYISFLVAGGYRTASPVPVASPSPANLPTPAEITASTMAEAVHMELQKSRDDGTKAMVQRIEAESLAKLAQTPITVPQPIPMPVSQTAIAPANLAASPQTTSQPTPASVHSYTDSSGNMYSVSDADYQRLFPIKLALDSESHQLDKLQTQLDAQANRISQDRGNLDNTDSGAVDNFNTKVDAYNSSQVYVQKQTDVFNARVNSFNQELHRVGTLQK